jgi:glycosyltransferase involved in cell wall biosynthesis
MASHLILARELPPSPYAPGGIGTYIWNVAHLLADAGETVHLLGQQWAAAPRERESLTDGRLIVHRVPIDAPISRPHASTTQQEIQALRTSFRPERAWRWNATIAAESLVLDAGIDLIEAPEYEAPLTWFLSRRSRGEGPDRTPPCIVHLHSPTEFVWRHNGWSTEGEALKSIRREEEANIAQADALVCPSLWMAREASHRYGFARERLAVIPYPLGSCDTEPQPTCDDTGPVLYVGRLEARKGVIEFVTAAVGVSRVDPTVRFHFIGSDVTSPDGASTLALLKGMIPRDLASRFRFSGSVPHAELMAPLASARFVVVPSRWDNFPNVCMEAMQAGRPVLVTPCGGMTELVADGKSGWVAPGASSDALEEALRRAVATTRAQLDCMGANARRTVHERCGRETILERQLAFRSAVIARGAHRSLREQVPGSLAPTEREAVHRVPNMSHVNGRHPDRWTGLSYDDLLRLTTRQKVDLAAASLRDPSRVLAWIGNRIRGS